MALPELRDELSVFPGPSSVTGTPTWSLYDPVRNLYFRLDWVTFEILCRWSMNSGEDICKAINTETTLTLNNDAIDTVKEFLFQRDLIKLSTSEDTKRIAREYNRRQRSWNSHIIHSYLFFRVPLLKPDAFLTRTLPFVRWLSGTFFRILTLCALAIGLFLAGRQWDTFTTYFVDLFSFNGILAYAFTLIFIKFVHELGHAYTAKHLGCRIPTIGVAFLVLFPMAYTDVNDVWRVPERKGRLMVGVAGILTELTIAAWATFLWSIFPDGALRTGFFLLATTTWISTVLINASPFLRFDGYFLLMDGLDFPNLHSRAFAMTRWRLRELLFKLNDPQPEILSTSMKWFLQIFSLFTWIYRLIVFGGIAILVYLMFPKPIGPLLAVIEIYWFIAKPILSEFMIWKSRWRDIVKSLRTLFTLFIISIVVLVLTIAWDPRISTQGVLSSSSTSPVIAFEPGQVIKIMKANGDYIAEDEGLIQLLSPDLAMQKKVLETKLQGLKSSIALAEITPSAQSQLSVLRARLNAENAKLSALEEKAKGFKIKASIFGELTWFDQDIKKGDWLKAGEELGIIRQNSSMQVTSFVNQEALRRISVGSRAIFIDEVGRFDPIKLIVSEIDVDATRVLGQPLLASTQGGRILVRETSSQLIPENAIYKIRLNFASPVNFEKSPTIRGNLILYGTPEAWITKYYRSFMALFQREAGF